MLVTTTHTLQDRSIRQYYGIVSGRSASYEKELRRAKATAIDEMIAQAQDYGANAVIGVDLDYEAIGANGSMLMVVATGTAVLVE